MTSELRHLFVIMVCYIRLRFTKSRCGLYVVSRQINVIFYICYPITKQLFHVIAFSPAENQFDLENFVTLAQKVNECLYILIGVIDFFC